MHEQELLSGSWNASWAANRAPFFIFLILRFFGWRAAHGVSMRTWFPCSCMTANSWIEQSRDAMQGTRQAFQKKSRPFHRCRHRWWLSQSSWGWTCFCSKPVYMTTCLKKNSDCQAAFWHSLRNLRADFLRMLNHWCAHIRFALTLGSNHAWPGMQILASQRSIKAGHVWVKSQTIFWNWAAIFGSQLLLLLFFLVQHDLLSHTALILVQASKAGKHQHHLQSSLPFHQSVSREFYWDSFSRNFIAMKLFTIQIIQVSPTPQSNTQLTKCFSLMHSVRLARSALWWMMNIRAKELVAFWPQAVQSKLGSNSQSLASWHVGDSLDVLSVLTTLGHLHDLHVRNMSAILPS